ncbi:MAG: hypothetical protein HQK70_02315 [Desulfamplus sp.]|nr:hypothetical protein [Desulfamplus sp.]
MVFLETFNLKIDETQFECLRNPEKEAKVLQVTELHPNFMHGKGIRD